MAKNVYLVRHGESESNVGLVSRGHTALLTPKGEIQAQMIAQRCAKLPVDLIVSSGYPRADKTAAYIAEAVPRPLIQSDLFVERRQPSSTIGILHDDPRYEAYLDAFWDRFTDPTCRHEDAENFDDLKLRALQALQFLIDRPEKNILVVGHGLFSRILAAAATYGEEMSARECLGLLYALYTENTGISLLKYIPDRGRPPWRIMLWNDDAHLG
ncbi:MAG TPA: histidine phosphatase family protein [Candidatus Paceibacterota bacterium]|nr:histidine phosphatase family protein [Candidatus Paceibacterota bacterium]